MNAKCALMTCCFNEFEFIKLWYGYYSKHFADCDIFILDDGSDDGLYDGMNVEIRSFSSKLGPGEKKGMDDSRMNSQIKKLFNELLLRYEYVLHSDCDEFVVPDPRRWPGGLKEYIENFQDEFAQCSGYNVLHTTGVPLDITKPLLPQRMHWQRDWNHYCKVLLARSDPKWGGGLHSSRWQTNHNPLIYDIERQDFRLIHMHYACPDLIRRRYEQRRTDCGNFDPKKADEIVSHFSNREDMPAELIPEHWKVAF